MGWQEHVAIESELRYLLEDLRGLMLEQSEVLEAAVTVESKPTITKYFNFRYLR